MAEKESPKWEIVAREARGAFLQIADEKVWNREIIFALQAIRGSKFLQECDPDSLRSAVINVSLVGTTLNPALQKAFLVPRKVGGKMRCCLDISYRGLADIAMDSGSVKHLAPRIVYDFDEFSYEERDGETHIIHRPSLTPPDDFVKDQAKAFWSRLVCGYLVATLFDGSKAYYLYPKWKLEKAMKTSKTTSDDTPWRTHPDEMCLKTMIKHSQKTLPQTERLSTAVSILNEHEGLATKKGEKAEELMRRFGDGPSDVDITAEQNGQAADKMPEETRGEKISTLQAQALVGTLRQGKIEESEFLERYGIKEIAYLPANQHQEAVQWVLKEAENRR